MKPVALLLLLLAVVVSTALSGCATPGSAPNLGPALENPLFVAVSDAEFVHNQTVDALDNYFRIRYEQRVRSFDGVQAEGNITTFPLIGSTYLEPWRSDSTVGYERLQATLQTIRRRCEARIIPTGGGFAIEIAVYKDLEDLLQPEGSTAGGATLRYDTSIVQNDENYEVLPPGSLGWIPLGRDITLEQRILNDLRERLVNGVPSVLPQAPAAAPMQGVQGELIPAPAGY
ncbi:hypothetical protein [Lignipirellula cremea]|uniref:ABC-type transport auxiliary lipoprotein component domain-containing protein n=1 Tax=Lignipirellula cremea TaxID=2528010 RepID=A0A518DUI0_9BACT|nr:hypothetical protein [Lignipirellula cremea]QDU95497.1 hypothetical protein Pla8534_33120 [Lignipirellula cremea]